MWPQFRSPLLWDVFAVGTYATVSLLFWYTGMVPALATLRDRAKGKISQIAYGIASLGWNGSSRHWHRFEKAYIILAGLCTPLVLSVHSVVSFDFAIAQLPGWHTTVFPPYFVAGAIFGGFAMVLTLAVPCRVWFGLQDIITERHIDNCCRVMLGVGMICGYAYALEFFVAWYSGHHFEQFVFLNRPFGNISWGFWTLIFCNVIGPQILWFKWARRNVWTIMFAAMCVNIGMWFERYVIVVSSLSRDSSRRAGPTSSPPGWTSGCSSAASGCSSPTSCCSSSSCPSSPWPRSKPSCPPPTCTTPAAPATANTAT